ncbi:MAG TPA: hydrogenase expression protein HupH [Firmicutes bacterium]|nr:hydrogenase expression protein HupH [Bacillota bacterium]
MRLRVIIPNSSEEFRVGQVEERRRAAGPGVDVDVICLGHGPESIESSYDETLAGPHVLEEIERAEREGYDAVTIDCAGDVAIRAVKEAARIPVVSAGEASIIYALALGDRFSVVTVLQETARLIEHNVRAKGLGERLASVRAVNIPVLELENHERTSSALLAVARQAIAEDGADVIVLGCTGMSPVARRLAAELPVPVVDPAVAAIELAKGLVGMGLTQSKRAFPSPRPKKVK